MSFTVKRLLQLCAVLLASLGLLMAPAHAMRVSPMVIEMDSSGSGAVARIEVQNVNPGRLAFETRVYRLKFDNDGNITEEAADEDFLIFPPQGALSPGGRQVVRLQWVGQQELPTSEAYYVAVEQLPVALEPTGTETVGAQVQVLYNMRALVVVAPKGAKPDVEAKSASAARYQLPPAEGQTEPVVVEGVRIVLKNEGRRHAMMSNFGWKLEGTDVDGNWLRVDLTPAELAQAVGTGYVPALGERSFDLPVTGFGPGPIKLTFLR